MKKKLIIYGIGKYAEYAQYVFNHDSEYDVVSFCIEDPLYNTEEWVNDTPLISLGSCLKDYSTEDYSIFIAVGNNGIRKRIFDTFSHTSFSMANYLSSKSACWENLKLGRNIFIDEGCVLQPFVEIDDNTILFTSQIGHHTQIGVGSLISGAKTGGNVKIGANCYIGLNASIKQNVSIANNSIIGMGCIIEKDTKINEVYTHKGTTKRNITSDQILSRFLK